MASRYGCVDVVVMAWIPKQEKKKAWDGPHSEERRSERGSESLESERIARD